MGENLDIKLSLAKMKIICFVEVFKLRFDVFKCVLLGLFSHILY